MRTNPISNPQSHLQTLNKSHNNDSPSRALKVNNSVLQSDTDSEIENDLPVHPKGYKDQWAAIMKMMDEEDVEKV